MRADKPLSIQFDIVRGSAKAHGASLLERRATALSTARPANPAAALPGSGLARFLDLRGYRVFEACGVLWAHYRGPFYCSLPYQLEIDLGRGEIAELMRRFRIPALRFPSSRPGGLASGIYMCRTADYALNKLSRQYRAHVRRALDQCEIRPVDPAELIEEGHRLNLETMERQRRYDPEFGDPVRWKRFVGAIRESPGVTVTGAYLSGRLSVFGVNCQEDGWLHLLYKMSRTQDRANPVSHALDYSLIQAASADPTVQFVSNAYLSVLENPGLDQYKRRMGFTVAPLTMAVYLHPVVAPLLTSEVTVSVARAVRDMRPNTPSLELAAKVFESARNTMTNHFPIMNTRGQQEDACQHLDVRRYSRFWRPYPIFLLRAAIKRLKTDGLACAASGAQKSVMRRLGADAKDKNPGTAIQGGEVLSLQPGEWVQVRSEEEIRATLDHQGKHRGMAFVPTEMLVHCGRQYRVLKRVERIFLEESKTNRKLKNTVLLEGAHCQGIGLDCDRCCFLFWREAWLKRIDSPEVGR